MKHQEHLRQMEESEKCRLFIQTDCAECALRPGFTVPPVAVTPPPDEAQANRLLLKTSQRALVLPEGPQRPSRASQTYEQSRPQGCRLI